MEMVVSVCWSHVQRMDWSSRSGYEKAENTIVCIHIHVSTGSHVYYICTYNAFTYGTLHKKLCKSREARELKLAKHCRKLFANV